MAAPLPKTAKVALIVGGSFLAAVAVSGILVLVVLWVVVIGKSHPSDAQLETLLRTQRPLVDSLVGMALHDRVEAVDRTWVRPEGALTPARWNLYRELFDRLDIESGIRQYTPGTIQILFSTQGLATGGSSKGLALHPTDSVNAYPNLDRRPPGTRFGNGYRKLWDGWYIFHDWDD